MKTRRLMLFFVIMAFCSSAPIARAVSYTWTQTAAGTTNWNDATKWGGAGFPNATGDVANAAIDIAGGQTINLNVAITVGSLTYGDSTSNFFSQTIAPGTSGSLIFNNGGSGATLTQASAVNGQPGNITAPITLNDNLTIVNNATKDGPNDAIQLTGKITGTGGITLNAGGGGDFYFSSTSSDYSGGLTLNGANVTFVFGQNSAAFGTGPITVNAGRLQGSTPGGGAYFLTTDNPNVWNGSFDTSAVWNNNGSVTLGANVSVSRNQLNLGGNISETGGSRSLTFTSGIGFLNGTNSYSGGTTVSGGTLGFLRTASMPSVGNVSFANGTTMAIGLGGSGWTSTGTGAGTLAGIFDGANVGVGPGSSTFSYTTAVGLNLVVFGTNTFGAIENLGSGATAFTKSGIGSLTMTGDNAYTGATTFQGGGSLILDYGSSDASKFVSTQPLTLGGLSSGGGSDMGYFGGGTITVKGGTFTEVVSATSLNAGGTFIARDGGTTAKLRLNAVSRAAGATISFADATIAETDTLNKNSILGGWATIGNDWAINSTNGADTAITALAAYDGALPTSGGLSNANYTLTGNVSLTGGTAANTVKISNTVDSEALDLGSYNLTITTSPTGGMMYAGGADGNYAITGGVGRIVSSGTSGELIFAVNSGVLTVSAIIGTTGQNSPLTKSGAGTLVISSNFTGTGVQSVNQGVLRLANSAASGSAAASYSSPNLLVQNGAALELTGGFSFTLAERIYISGTGVSGSGALRNISGANNWRGSIDTGIGGARINNDDSVSLLTLSGGMTTFMGGDITFGGVGNITVSTAAIIGGGGIVKDGNGTLTLSFANKYIGKTTVEEGILALSGTGSKLPDGAELWIAAGAKVNLAAGQNETVYSLYLNNKPMAAGSWGSSTSAAANKNDSYFQGDGILTVTTTGPVIFPPGGTIFIIK